MAVTDYLKTHRERHLAELLDWLRIPSISAKSEHRDDVSERRSGWWSACWRRVCRRRSHPHRGHPIVVGEWRGARGAPTLLVYGHYDVQPAEPLDEWSSPPFEPTVRDGKLFARGSVDDKGQVFLYLKAVEAHIASRHAPGQPRLHRGGRGGDRLAEPRGVPRGEPRAPRLRRGADLGYGDVRRGCPRSPRGCAGSRTWRSVCRARARPPFRLVRRRCGEPGERAGEDHRAAARRAGAGDHSRLLRRRDGSRAERAQSGAPLREEELREEVGSPALGGEEGFNALERMWARPTSTSTGCSPATPARAPRPCFRPARWRRSRCGSCRTRTPRHRGEVLELRKVARPGGCDGGGRVAARREPWYADPKDPVFEKAARALERAFGRAPVFSARAARSRSCGPSSDLRCAGRPDGLRAARLERARARRVVLAGQLLPRYRSHGDPFR